MITANNPDAKYMMIVIKNLQSLGTSSCREAGLNINLSQTSNLKVSPHHLPAYTCAAHQISSLMTTPKNDKLMMKWKE